MTKSLVDFCKEWLDTFVVAISVAMAFRAYFYEPFNIPTGSMMPTLYGNHSVVAKPSDATLWDKGPLKVLKWAWTGDWFKDIKAPATGTLLMQDPNNGCFRISVSTLPGKTYDVPTDAFRRTAEGVPYLPNGLRPGSTVRAGEQIWCGTVKSGDFLFVNRWIWNFRHPKRGEVMIFATTGLNGVQQGTHYIKRMTGLPGEELTMDPPRLVVNGKHAAGEVHRDGRIPVRGLQLLGIRGPAVQRAWEDSCQAGRRCQARGGRILCVRGQLACELRQPLVGACPGQAPARPRRRSLLAVWIPEMGHDKVIYRERGTKKWAIN